MAGSYLSLTVAPSLPAPTDAAAAAAQEPTVGAAVHLGPVAQLQVPLGPALPALQAAETLGLTSPAVARIPIDPAAAATTTAAAAQQAAAEAAGGPSSQQQQQAATAMLVVPIEAGMAAVAAAEQLGTTSATTAAAVVALPLSLPEAAALAQVAALPHDWAAAGCSTPEHAIARAAATSRLTPGAIRRQVAQLASITSSNIAAVDQMVQLETEALQREVLASGAIAPEESPAPLAEEEQGQCQGVHVRGEEQQLLQLALEMAAAPTHAAPAAGGGADGSSRQQGQGMAGRALEFSPSPAAQPQPAEAPVVYSQPGDAAQAQFISMGSDAAARAASSMAPAPTLTTPTAATPTAAPSHPPDYDLEQGLPSPEAAQPEAAGAATTPTPLAALASPPAAQVHASPSAPPVPMHSPAAAPQPQPQDAGLLRHGTAAAHLLAAAGPAVQAALSEELEPMLAQAAGHPAPATSSSAAPPQPPSPAAHPPAADPSAQAALSHLLERGVAAEAAVHPAPQPPHSPRPLPAYASGPARPLSELLAASGASGAPPALAAAVVHPGSAHRAAEEASLPPARSSSREFAKLPVPCSSSLSLLALPLHLAGAGV